MSSYAEALLEFYNGEVGGEALYSTLLGSARNQEEILKWSTLLQLETETKAWLRAPMVAHGVSIEELRPGKGSRGGRPDQVTRLEGEDAGAARCDQRSVRAALSGLR